MTRNLGACETATGFVAVEIKASPRWDKRFNRGLHRIKQALGKDKTTCYGIYLCERPALWDDIHILPVFEFLKRLWSGGIIQ